MSSRTDPGVDYRHAKAAVTEHLRAQAQAEDALARWLYAHRGVPSDQLFNRDTGASLDPEHRALEAAVDQAVRDVAWCKALVIACGEVVKGRPFEEVS